MFKKLIIMVCVDNTPCPINLLNGIRSLVTTLKSWITGTQNLYCSFWEEGQTNLVYTLHYTALRDLL